MCSEKVDRKLCAVLSADVEGYSRLMGEDELATIQTLQTYQKVMAAIVEQFRGRVVDAPGDNILIEFASVVDAVECAITIQHEIKRRNAELPENSRMKFRIGINVGDVIEDKGRLYGDGVNIAARLENLAEGGGICISGMAHDQVETKLPLKYEYLGRKQVKNIFKPLRVYRILSETQAQEEPARERRHHWKRGAQLAIIILLLASAASLAWWKFSFIKDAQAKKAAIVVLPFQNLSDDPEQEYFSNGLTNDIITELSRFRDLFVISGNTSFTYKDKPVKVKDLAGELKVDYVLEGSVQKIGEQVRVNVQLIDAKNESHLWADRYDRRLDNVFALQNEIIHKTVVSLAVKIGQTERERASQGETGNVKAYDYKLKGMDRLLRQERAFNQEARDFFKKAIELDPDYASAYSGLARTHLADCTNGWTDSPEYSLQTALYYAQEALSRDESSASAHAVLGQVYNCRQQFDLAVAELQQAIKLNFNDTHSYGLLGEVMLHQGKTQEAIQLLETAMRFDPNAAPDNFMNLGFAYFLTGRYRQAINLLNQGIARRSDFSGLHIALSAAYTGIGEIQQARQEADIVLRLNPSFNSGTFCQVFRNHKDRAVIIAGLRKAGLPG